MKPMWRKELSCKSNSTKLKNNFQNFQGDRDHCLLCPSFLHCSCTSHHLSTFWMKLILPWICHTLKILVTWSAKDSLNRNSFWSLWRKACSKMLTSFIESILPKGRAKSTDKLLRKSDFYFELICAFFNVNSLHSI